MSSNHIPPEIWLTVFSHACTDTGRTGHSLSLVCRVFHDLTVGTGLDIQSVRLRGDLSMVKFLKMLGKRQKNRKRVRRLFLANIPTTSYFDHYETLMHWILCSIDTDYLNTLSICVSPHSLVVDYPTFSCTDILSVALPALTSLAIYAPLPLKVIETARPVNSLSKLDIAFINAPPVDLDHRISVIAPNVQYLRISDVGYNMYAHSNLPGILRQLIHKDRHPGSTSSSPSSFPSSLREVGVQLRPFYRVSHWLGEYSTTRLDRYNQFRTELEETVHEQNRYSDEHARVRVVLSKPPDARTDGDFLEDEEGRYQRRLLEWLDA